MMRFNFRCSSRLFFFRAYNSSCKIGFSIHFFPFIHKNLVKARYPKFKIHLIKHANKETKIRNALFRSLLINCTDCTDSLHSSLASFHVMDAQVKRRPSAVENSHTMEIIFVFVHSLLIAVYWKLKGEQRITTKDEKRNSNN